MDVCLQYFLNVGGTEILWIQWWVILVLDGTNILNNHVVQACYKCAEDVIIRWDKNKEINESVSELPQCLLRSKCDPMENHIHGFWRFD